MLLSNQGASEEFPSQGLLFTNMVGNKVSHEDKVGPRATESMASMAAVSSGVNGFTALRCCWPQLLMWSREQKSPGGSSLGSVWLLSVTVDKHLMTFPQVYVQYGPSTLWTSGRCLSFCFAWIQHFTSVTKTLLIKNRYLNFQYNWIYLFHHALYTRP